MIGKPKLTEYPIVQEVAKKLGATPAQVLVAWGVYRGYSVIPKSVQEERIVSNFKQVELSKEDYEKITSIGEGNHTRWVFEFGKPPTRVPFTILTLDVRFNIPLTYTPKWDINVFDEPIEKQATHGVKIQ